MKKLSKAGQTKIETIIDKLLKIQLELYRFPNQNASFAAFEIDQVVEKLADYKTWYMKPKS